MLYIYLLFVIYSSLAGSVEAILYGKQGAETFKWNEHILYVLKASFVLGGYLLAPYLVQMSIMESLVCFIISAVSYPFFHDGFYYETARRINRPDYKFSSNSKTSTADIEIPWAIRLNAFLLSIITLLIYIFIWQ